MGRTMEEEKKERKTLRMGEGEGRKRTGGFKNLRDDFRLQGGRQLRRKRGGIEEKGKIDNF